MSAYVYRAVAILVITACMKREVHSQNRAFTLGGSQRDMISDIAVDVNGNSYLSCYTESDDGDFVRQRMGNGDLCVVKLDQNNQVRWKTTVATFGSFGGPTNMPMCVHTQQGCYVATDISWNSSSVPNRVNTGSDLLVAQIDTSGQILWKSIVGGTRDDVPYSMIPTADGGIVIAGYTVSRDGDFERKGKYRFDKDMFLMKLSSQGNVLWTHTFGGSRDDVFSCVRSTADGGWIATGWSESDNNDFEDLNKGSTDAFVMKIDRSGKAEWVKTYGTNGSDNAIELCPTRDGGWVVVGTTQGRGWLHKFIMGLFSSVDCDGDFAGKLKGYRDAFVMKVDSKGNILWSSVIGGVDDESCSGISINDNDEIMAVGRYNSGDGDFQNEHSYGDLGGVFVSKYDSDGNRLWIKTIKGSNDEWSTCNAVRKGEVLVGVNSYSNDGDFLELKRGWTDIHVFSVKNE